MALNKCPGSDERNIKAEIRICPNCGYQVEMFSDELKTRCPQCRTWVERERLPACIDWCKAAKECLGEERWKRLKGKEKKNKKDLSK